MLNKTEIQPEQNEIIDEDKEKQAQKIEVVYSKMEQGKYFGHLELVNILLRAIRKIGIPIQFSRGYHPMPKISFEDPLPLGMESEEERFFISVDKDFDFKNLDQQLNSMLPEGIVVKECHAVEKVLKDQNNQCIMYSIELADGYFSENKLEDYLKSEKFNIIKTRKNGKQKLLDMKKIVEDLKIFDHNRLLVITSCESGKKLRPSEIVKNIFGLSEASIHQARIIKLLVGKGKNVQTTSY
jgi:radical SAM-linked protein